MSDCKFLYQEIIRDLPKQLKIVDFSAGMLYTNSVLYLGTYRIGYYKTANHPYE
jgi:hypothetical protein